jgi:FkbM family methyltransferase
MDAKGIKIKLERLCRDELFFQNIVLNEEYNPPGYEIKETDTVIDIGGNIGIFAMFAGKRATKGRVLTFEPVEQNYRFLLQNIKLNKATNVVATKAAVSASRGHVRVFLNNLNKGCHSLFDVNATRPDQLYEDVPSVSLQDIMDDFDVKRCHFLKLDCEGAEYQILNGLPHSFFNRIDRIVMEYHTTVDPEQTVKQSDELIEHLQHVGYQIDAYESFSGGGFIRARRL